MKAILFCTVGALLANARAQNSIEQVRSSTQAPAGDVRGEAQMIAEDRGQVVELGGQPARTLRFRTGISSVLEYQSNAPLLPSGPRNDWVSTSVIEAGWAQPLSPSVTFDLSLRTEVAGYFHFDQLSYWGPSGVALFDWHPRASWPHFYAGTQLYEYDYIRSAREITDAAAVLAGAERAWDFCNGRTRLTLGYQFADYWAHPRSEDRTTHTLFTAATLQIVGALYAQASYFWQYTDFDSVARHDSRHVVGLGLLYAVNERMSARLYTNFVRNESSLAAADYENYSSGLGGAFSIRF